MTTAHILRQIAEHLGDLNATITVCHSGIDISTNLDDACLIAARLNGERIADKMVGPRRYAQLAARIDDRPVRIWGGYPASEVAA